MSAIVTPWTRQPPAVTPIDAQNPLCAGIKYVIDPWYVNPKDFSLVGTKQRATPKGGMQRGFYSTYGTGTNTDRIALTPKSNTLTAAKFSWMFLINRTGFIGANGRVLSQVNELNVVVASPANTQIGMDFSTTDPVFIYPATPVDRDCVFIITMDGAGANDPSVYYDGILQTITSRSPAPVGTLLPNTSLWSLGNRTSDLARSFEGSLGLFVYWDRILSTSDVTALSQNPWRIYRPPTPGMSWVLGIIAGGANGSGGSVWNVSTAESIALSDIEASAFLASAAAAESIALSDIEASAFLASAAAAESIALSEVISAVNVLLATQSEAATLSESETSNAVTSGAQAETLSLAEVVASILLASISTAESMSLSDVQASSFITASAQSESISLSDSETGMLGGIQGDRVEAMSLTEVVANTILASAARDEAMSLSEVVANILTTGGAQSESISLTDAQDRGLSTGAARTEATALTDSQTGMLGGVQGDQVESIVLSDAATSIALLVAGVIEAIALSEATTNTAFLGVVQIEGLTLSDISNTPTTYSVVITESMTLQELVLTLGALISDPRFIVTLPIRARQVTLPIRVRQVTLQARDFTATLH